MITYEKINDSTMKSTEQVSNEKTYNIEQLYQNKELLEIRRVMVQKEMDETLALIAEAKNLGIEYVLK